MPQCPNAQDMNLSGDSLTSTSNQKLGPLIYLSGPVSQGQWHIFVIYIYMSHNKQSKNYFKPIEITLFGEMIKKNKEKEIIDNWVPLYKSFDNVSFSRKSAMSNIGSEVAM